MATKQKKIGIILSLFSFAVLLLRFFTSSNFIGLETLLILAVSLILLASMFIENNIFKIIQCILLMFLGSFYIIKETNTFFGYWIYINFLILSYKYGYFNKNLNLKVLISLIPLFISLTLATLIVLNSGNPWQFILGYLAFGGVSFLLLYILFEEDLINAVKEKEEINKALLEVKSISIIGERASSIVHSLKNNISQLNASLMYIEENIDREKGIKNIKQIIREINKRVDTIMLVSKSSYSSEKTIFDSSVVLESILSLFMCERTFVALINLETNLKKEVYLESVEIEFIMVVENIIKNSIEAIIEKEELGRMGNLLIILTNDYLEIKNSGNPIHQCKNCKFKRCSKECKVFNRIGNTSKKKGSGNGITQIFKTVNKNKWEIKISNLPDGVSYKIYFKEQQ